MSGSALTAVAFAVTAGQLADARTVVSVDQVPGPGGRRLLVSVEPLEPSPRGFELASLALSTIREAFAGAGNRSPGAALLHAFAEANATLINENRPIAGCRWERRVFVGATAIAIQGRTVTVAQVPATQALVIQERQLYAFPDLASWRSDYIPATDRPAPDPLGYREGIQPDLYQTIAARGDLIVLCSSAVARSLARSGFGPGDPRAACFLAGDLDGCLDRMGQVVLANDLADAHVAGIVIDWVPAVDLGVGSSTGILARHGRLVGDRRQPSGSIPNAGHPLRQWDTARPRVAMATTAPIVSMVEAAAGDNASPVGRGAGVAAPAGWTGFDPKPEVIVERRSTLTLPRTTPAAAAPGRLGTLHLAMMRGAEWLLAPTARRRLTLDKRSRLYGAPGARSVRCYRGGGVPGLPTEVRARLPRGPMIHLPGRVLAIVVVLLLSLGSSGLAVARQRDRSENAREYLARSDTYAASATRGFGDEAVESLTRALNELQRAEDNGASETEVSQRRDAFSLALDQVTGIERFGEIVKIGDLPEVLPASPARLVRAGSDVYLVAGGLFHLDVGGQRLVRLLTPGQRVGDGAVQMLTDGSATGGRVVVTDGMAIYTNDEGQRWSRHPLGVDADGAPALLAACSLFQGSFYGLQPAKGRVLKFDGAKLQGTPEEWAHLGDVPDLGLARDLVVDGQIFVLLDDGRILTLFRGVQHATISPEIDPPLLHPVALDGGLDSNFLYVAEPKTERDGSVGRVIGVDRTGAVVWQLLPRSDEDDAAEAALADVRDLVVDEPNGVLYFLTSDAVWQATLPTT